MGPCGYTLVGSSKPSNPEFMDTLTGQVLNTQESGVETPMIYSTSTVY